MSTQETWVAALNARGLATDPVVTGWLEALSNPDEDAELEGRIALHARSLGEDGTPPSRLLLALDLLTLAADRLDRRESLLRVAADAHAVGLAARHQSRLRQLLYEECPVLALPGGRVLIAPVGPFDTAAQVDSAFGRAAELAVAHRSHEIVLSLASATELDDSLLQASLRAWPRHELGGRIRLVLTGLNPSWREWVETSGLMPQVRAEDQLARLAPEAH